MRQLAGRSFIPANRTQQEQKSSPRRLKGADREKALHRAGSVGTARPPAPAAAGVGRLRSTSRSEGAVARSAAGFRRPLAASPGGPRFKRLFPKNPKIGGEWWRKRGVTGANKRGPEGVEGAQNGIGVCEIAHFRAQYRLRHRQRKTAIFAAAQALLHLQPSRWWRRFRRGGRHPEASASARTRGMIGFMVSVWAGITAAGGRVTGPKRTARPDIGEQAAQGVSVSGRPRTSGSDPSAAACRPPGDTARA